jgi:hypothetical protein
VTPEQIAAVEKLTRELTEFAEVMRNIRASFDLLAQIDPAAARVAAAIVENAFNGAAR